MSADSKKTLLLILVFVLGMGWGLIGPVNRLMINDIETTKFTYIIDAYLWPTHFLAFGEGGWYPASITANVLLFGVIALVIYCSLERATRLWVIFCAVVIWGALVGSFIAGFRLRDFQVLPFSAGPLFYAAFVSLIIFIKKHRLFGNSPG
ncbi:MAG TPA: hypothetical protein PJ986_07720 [Gammaproteobacteria bacterium]|nr:hypothetical protein [Gammaproteobacteria bacterium]